MFKNQPYVYFFRISGQPYRPYEPIWFKQEKDPITGSLVHVYNGKYWEAKEKKDWSMCPDIFWYWSLFFMVMYNF